MTSILRVNGEAPGSGRLYARLIEQVERFPVEIGRVFPMPYCEEAKFFDKAGLTTTIGKETIGISRDSDGTTIAFALSTIVKGAKGIFFLHYPHYNTMEMTVYANQASVCEIAIAKIEEIAASFKPPRKQETQFKINFCSSAMQGINLLERMIECPSWKRIEANYPNPQAKEALKIENIKAGKLLFWHGPPGTGKTYLIRALIRAWNKQANFMYVMDPERLFDDANYMLSLLTQQDRGPGRWLSKSKMGRSARRYEDDENEGESPYTVLVLEDTLDLLLAENRARVGPAISRLLNLTEGIIGQGFKVLLLMTTNEPVSNIDPAFLRPGRCAQSLEFPLFSSEQGQQWADRNKSWWPEGQEPISLAQLYALKSNRPMKFDSLVPKEISGFKEAK